MDLNILDLYCSLMLKSSHLWSENPCAWASESFGMTLVVFHTFLGLWYDKIPFIFVISSHLFTLLCQCSQVQKLSFNFSTTRPHVFSYSGMRKLPHYKQWCFLPRLPPILTFSGLPASFQSKWYSWMFQRNCNLNWLSLVIALLRHLPNSFIHSPLWPLPISCFTFTIYHLPSVFHLRKLKTFYQLSFLLYPFSLLYCTFLSF